VVESVYSAVRTDSLCKADCVRSLERLIYELQVLTLNVGCRIPISEVCVTYTDRENILLYKINILYLLRMEIYMNTWVITFVMRC